MIGQIGFRGLGVMGLGMARRLLAAGYAVYGYDTDASRLAAFVAFGGQAGRGDDLADANVMVTMLPGPAAIKATVERYCESDAHGRCCFSTAPRQTSRLPVASHLWPTAAVTPLSMRPCQAVTKWRRAARSALWWAATRRLSNAPSPSLPPWVDVTCTSAASAGRAVSEGFALAARLGLDQHKVADLWLNAGVRS